MHGVYVVRCGGPECSCLASPIRPTHELSLRCLPPFFLHSYRMEVIERLQGHAVRVLLISRHPVGCLWHQFCSSFTCSSLLFSFAPFPPRSTRTSNLHSLNSTPQASFFWPSYHAHAHTQADPDRRQACAHVHARLIFFSTIILLSFLPDTLCSF